MKHKFETLIRHLIGTDDINSLSKIDITAQFCPDENEWQSVLRNLNAAFLIVLSGESHPSYEKAAGYLNRAKGQTQFENIVSFYNDGLDLLHAENENAYKKDIKFKEALDTAYSWIISLSNMPIHEEIRNNLWQVFFPEGVFLSENQNEKIKLLREKRRVHIRQLNPSPIKNPARELLFTSNILLTTPLNADQLDALELTPSLRESIGQVIREDQLYWYDHPIPIGIEHERNEAFYGLRELDEAVEFEKQRGIIKLDDRLDCVLSVSVTHKGLHNIAKKYIEEEFGKGKKIKNLNLYIFTEADTSRLIDEVLVPAAEKYRVSVDKVGFHEIIGVDGRYGRHYTFLKAISAFWQIFMDTKIKGTFKIDLDQVFPQKELVEQTGFSAFENLKTPLWGAEGIDSHGDHVELGMIAGSLVNKKDISKSLFYPDVCFPPDEIKGDELIFLSQLTQALSTEAEMMTHYNDETLNGISSCIQRIHVTGGTCGILIQSLRKYRPFTPIYIGRAEDQAYILSVLFSDAQKNLRYVHKDGLIMRHDKESFAGDAIEAAYTGKVIGDFIRVLLFSYYALALPWSVKRTKEMVDPFTGCFISRIPFTVVYLRLALKAASFFKNNKHNHRGVSFLEMGTKRLHEIIQELKKDPYSLIKKYHKEKEVWDSYYDVLNHVEEALKTKNIFALELQKKALNLVKDCKIVG